MSSAYSLTHLHADSFLFAGFRRPNRLSTWAHHMPHPPNQCHPSEFTSMSLLISSIIDHHHHRLLTTPCLSLTVLLMKQSRGCQLLSTHQWWPASTRLCLSICLTRSARWLKHAILTFTEPVWVWVYVYTCAAYLCCLPGWLTDSTLPSFSHITQTVIV